ncbi:MAG: sulfatase-like hydrolase/transferase [Planctomycetota bacterium]|nr:sulfatase-like hydrolase/transferase [Planctomycetaceae bacterium]MDQ3330506.1 sulfatase-like hydrolase/transferase [Planctomycetota bacterium]
MHLRSPRGLALLVSFLTLALAGLKDGLAAGPPNLVVILADDLGAECLSSYGSLDYQTPRLDALAASGVRFTNAFAQPLCTPSRVQIMTGKYNFRNYVEFGYLPPKEVTFGDLMKAAGYKTCVAGKWQLSGSGRQYPEKTDPADWGFDEHCLWQLNNRAPYGDRGSRYWGPYIEQNGEVLEPGNDAYGPDVVAEFLMSFIERHKDQPFFAYYPMILTHGPYEPSPGSADRGKKNVKYFKDMVEHMDVIVGRIVDRIEALGLADDTIVIFTGDNGTGREVRTNTTNGVVPGGKGTMTDAGMHVPFIVRWPGKIARGTVSDRLVDFTDVVPSLLAATGTEKTNGFKTDGVAFLDAHGLSEQEREWTYSWYEARHGENGGRNNGIFARDHKYKLFSDDRFFDVSTRPLSGDGEPLANDDLSPEAKMSKAKLQAVIDQFAAEGAVLSEATTETPTPRPRNRRGRANKPE